jgi:hypothetical protein
MTPSDCDSLAPSLHPRLALAVALALGAIAPLAAASAETADEFVARLNREFAHTGLEVNAARWTQATFINVDTQLLNARRPTSTRAPSTTSPATSCLRERAEVTAGQHCFCRLRPL